MDRHALNHCQTTEYSSLMRETEACRLHLAFADHRSANSLTCSHLYSLSRAMCPSLEWVWVCNISASAIPIEKEFSEFECKWVQLRKTLVSVPEPKGNAYFASESWWAPHRLADLSSYLLSSSALRSLISTHLYNDNVFWYTNAAAFICASSILNEQTLEL